MKQADYVASRLTGGAIASDWHNALKLGYDVGGLRYPEWLVQFCATSLGRRTCGGDGENGDGGVLPTVVAPGGAFVAISGGIGLLGGP